MLFNIKENEVKKFDLAKNLIKKSENIFSCPLCQSPMNISFESNSLICTKNHCFDLSKNGYINLLPHSVKSEYGKEMLESRNILCKSGFFHPMTKSVSDLIIKTMAPFNKKSINMLDAGCGEGSHLKDILSATNINSKSNFKGIGIDISKEGIHIASREYQDAIWSVADLSKMPFKNNAFDIVLSILSPSNYSEFNRLLSSSGFLIKVIPGSDYLLELRSILYNNTDKEQYSNERVINHFSNNFNIVATEKVNYSVSLDRSLFKHLIKMTPLSWNVTDNKIQDALSLNIEKITVDLLILIGKKK